MLLLCNYDTISVVNKYVMRANSWKKSCLKLKKFYLCVKPRDTFFRKKATSPFEKGILLFTPCFESIFRNNVSHKNFANLRKSIGCFYRTRKASRIGPALAFLHQLYISRYHFYNFLEPRSTFSEKRLSSRIFLF